MSYVEMALTVFMALITLIKTHFISRQADSVVNAAGRQ